MANEARTREQHIATRRLFDSISPELQERVQLEDGELEHLLCCNECKHVREVFAKQFIAMKQKNEGNEAASAASTKSS